MCHFPTINPPMFRLRGETGNEDVFARHVAALEAKLDGYEAILSKQKYLAGDVWDSL